MSQRVLWFLPIWPSVDAPSVLLVVLVLALEDSSVCPSVLSSSVHVVVEPVAFVSSAVSPDVGALFGL